MDMFNYTGGHGARSDDHKFISKLKVLSEDLSEVCETYLINLTVT